LSSEANANARRMWNKLTTGGPLNEIHPSLVMKKRKEKKQTLQRACTVILISYAPRVFPLFPRNTAMPAIILTRTRVRYELFAVARCIWIPWIPRSYSENSEELCRLSYIVPWLNVHRSIKTPEITLNLCRSNNLTFRN